MRVDLAADGAPSKTKIHERSNSIRLERARIQATLADTTSDPNENGPKVAAETITETERPSSLTFSGASCSSKRVLVELLCRYSKLAKPSKPRHSDTLRSVPVAPVRVHAARRRLPAETIRQLIGDYQASVPSTQLAQRYGVSKGAVLRLLREHDVPIRRQSMTRAEIKQAIRLYQQGLSLAAVGTKLNYDQGTIHRALRQAGVPMRDSHGRER